METTKVLDCTLRDGGYCNHWQFGFKNSRTITSGLVEAGIDIIECGFITDTVDYNPDVTKYTEVSQITRIIPENKKGKLFVAMMNYGEYDLECLPECDNSSIDGIRVAFHKKDVNEALKLCERIKEKGYLVFVQAMVSLNYSDEEFLALIKRVNEIKPYAFYIVDSFGEMKRKDLIRLYYLVEHNLEPGIKIGFHSHNNLQLAYSNAQALVDINTSRELIIDSSIYGMGRGAGNLNTELFVDYLNEYENSSYDIKPLLSIIDEILSEFYQKNYWGYSLPNYISATHHAHPNYAGYLDDKKTLTVENMNTIFDLMDPDKRVAYDKEYIEKLYLKFMGSGKVQELHRNELQNRVAGKSILLIAAGKSAQEEKEEIIRFADNNDVVSVSVNYDYDGFTTDYIFLSNLRRYRELPREVREKCIVTSNIPAEGVYLQTSYNDLLFGEESVKDNAGMMALKLFTSFDIKEIYLAGFDGYAHDSSENFGDDRMAVVMKNAVVDEINESMMRILSKFSEEYPVHFLTKPKHIEF